MKKIIYWCLFGLICFFGGVVSASSFTNEKPFISENFIQYLNTAHAQN